MLKKYLFTAYSLLLSIVLFAQNGARESRPERFSDPEPNTLTPGTPIDTYTYILLGLAILSVVYIVYRNKRVSKA